MNTKVKLSILIATLGQREERFKALLDTLLPQADNFKGQIEVIAYWNNFERPLAEIRQELLDEAQGEYVCFIDDDDSVPEYYCKEIVRLLDGVDYIGWRMQLWHNGEKMKPTFHSLRYKNWSEDDKGWYRNISHLNPIKRELSILAGFIDKEDAPEDYDWVKRVEKYVNTEHYIPKIMYNYHHTTEDSYWAGGKPERSYTRPKVDNKNFKWHSKSKERYTYGDTSK